MKYLLAFILSLFIISCSNSDSAHPSEQISSGEADNSFQNDSLSAVVDIEGMNHLEGGSVTIGTNDKNFKANERPAMKVLLDYDFYMGIHEVTCGEYAKIAESAKLETFENCENDSLPLTDITYYDVILYANAKSKQENRDTVYTYRKAIFDNEKHCINLEGFAFHPDIAGYRLPTEAEWIYTATRAWDPKKGWNKENADFKIHTICSADADSANFCDMAGNVTEWVNDWFGLLHDTTITNYVGAPDGGELGERIIKGGYFAQSASEQNPYSRSDVYTVTSSTHAKYVGFRLALGKIPNALWMNNNGKSSESIVTPIANSETLKEHTKTVNAKLAFRNDISKRINYIDYRDGSLFVKELDNSIDAYHPEISPNGNWIAFCTSYEGIGGKSSLYVQNLNTDENPEPIKLNVESAAIPRWHVLENGDTSIVYVTDAGNNKEETSFKAMSTWQVTFANGSFGTPQKLFDGAYHDGISEDNSLSVTGSKLLRVRINNHDSIWYNGEQACNVSLVMDKSKRTAFLDFSGKTGRDFVGQKYATHERIFIADSTGNLIQSIKSPEGYTFDHIEWATDNINSNIVATLANTNGAHSKIVLINPLDSSITELAEGEELWHPSLWVKRIQTEPQTDSSQIFSSEIDTTFHLDPDSAGIYYKSGVTYKAVNMRIKMELLWKYKDTSNTVILGSSRAKNSIIPNQLSNPFHAINLGNSGFSINEIHYLYFNYVQHHVKNLKYLVVALDIDLWWIQYESNNNFFYSEAKDIPGYVYDQNHQFWKNGVPDNLYKLTFESIGGTTYAKKFRDTRGYEEYETASGWKENPTISRDTTWMQKEPALYENSFKLFKDIVESCSRNDVYVIGIIFPQSPAYKNTGSFGFNGPQRSSALAAIEDFKNLSKEYPYFILMDENKMGEHDYSNDMARDEEHLATLGAIKITSRLDTLLNSLK